MSQKKVISCDLCVVGAGIAGINALFVASQYLPKNARVVLVDQKPGPAGMWRDSYEYVRLHQPHRLFTAGNMKWQWDKPAGYLAARNEVVDHLSYCVRQLARHFNLTEIYQTQYQSHQETSDGQVEIELQRQQSDQQTLTIRAHKLIKATGFNIQVSKALTFSSKHIHSLAPEDKTMFGKEMSDSHAPIYIVGGGKTAMDTAYQAVTRYPGREVFVIAGKGTMFLSRDKFFPEGPVRYYGGITVLEILRDLSNMFDGKNQVDLMKFLLKNHGLALFPEAKQFLFGLLSNHEQETISQGCKAVYTDYLKDVVDDGGQTRMVFEKTPALTVPRNSWFINCTGFIMREEKPYEPFVSPTGRVISVQQTSGIKVFTTFGSYFLTHLSFLGLLDKLPIYELNHEAMMKKDKVAYPFVASMQLMYNILLILQNAPLKVLLQCDLNFDNWYPLIRQAPVIFDLKMHSKIYLEHYRKTLDFVAQHYGVRCGPVATQQETPRELRKAG